MRVLNVLKWTICHPVMRIHIHLVSQLKLFNLDAYAHNSQHYKDCNPDMLTDEGTSTG